MFRLRRSRNPFTSPAILLTIQRTLTHAFQHRLDELLRHHSATVCAMLYRKAIHLISTATFDQQLISHLSSLKTEANLYLSKIPATPLTIAHPLSLPEPPIEHQAAAALAACAATPPTLPEASVIPECQEAAGFATLSLSSPPRKGSALAGPGGVMRHSPTRHTRTAFIFKRPMPVPAPVFYGAPTASEEPDLKIFITICDSFLTTITEHSAFGNLFNIQAMEADPLKTLQDWKRTGGVPILFEFETPRKEKIFFDVSDDWNLEQLQEYMLRIIPADYPNKTPLVEFILNFAHQDGFLGYNTGYITSFWSEDIGLGIEGGGLQIHLRLLISGDWFFNITNYFKKFTSFSSGTAHTFQNRAEMPAVSTEITFVHSLITRYRILKIESKFTHFKALERIFHLRNIEKTLCEEAAIINTKI